VKSISKLKKPHWIGLYSLFVKANSFSLGPTELELIKEDKGWSVSKEKRK